jgi:MSHA pilin protein MshD
MCMNSRHQKGFTLIELIIFIVVVGAGLAGILAVSSTSIKSSADPLERKQALAIAESLLEEIVQKEYANPTGGYSGASRALFDDVDDYNNYASASIVDGAGNAIAGLSTYSISPAVAVTTTAVNGVSTKKVVVSVTGPQGVVSVTGYRANY